MYHGPHGERIKKAAVRKNITKEDIIQFCNTVGFAPSSLDSGQLQVLLQTLAMGPVWTAVARLVGSDSFQISSQVDFSTPVEIGDSITALVQAEERTKEGALNIRLICRNQRGELVLQARTISLITPPG